MDLEDERPEWFDMTKFVKSMQRIGLPPGPKQLPNIDIDRIPAPSPQGVDDQNHWHLAVRGWGVLVITEKGVRLLWRKDIGSATIDAFGTPFP